jgi:hypothetical protein
VGVGGNDHSSCSRSPLARSFPLYLLVTGSWMTNSQSASALFGSASGLGVSASGGVIPPRTWMYHPRLGLWIVYLSALEGSGVRISSMISLRASARVWTGQMRRRNQREQKKENEQAGAYLAPLCLSRLLILDIHFLAFENV